VSNARLGVLLKELRITSGDPLNSLTVLSSCNDPYRLDTPANHVNAGWFRDRMQECGLLDRENPIHNRGIHYAIVSMGSAMRPDGKPYRNDEDSWLFLQDKASKAARWLGYVPFDAISDARNSEPVIVTAEMPEPRHSIGVPMRWELPDESSLRPSVKLEGFDARQHYRLAIFGEKTSLQDVLRPITTRYDTDLYLPSGEISDTLIHTMAKTGAGANRRARAACVRCSRPSGNPPDRSLRG
jgi:hypothetical protein